MHSHCPADLSSAVKVTLVLISMVRYLCKYHMTEELLLTDSGLSSLSETLSLGDIDFTGYSQCRFWLRRSKQ